MPVAPETVRLGFGGRTVVVRSEAPEVLAALERRYAAMLSPGSGPPVARLEVRRNGHGYALGGSGLESEPDESLPNLLERVGQELAGIWMRARPDLLWLHAGAVVRRGAATLIVGAWGRGKSSLTTELVSRGWGYLSDEFVPLDPTTERVLPFPRTPMLRRGGEGRMPRERLPGLEKVPFELEERSVCRRPARPGAVVFPRYDPGARVRLRPCTPGEAVLELLRSCLNFAAFGRGAIDDLAWLAEVAPAHHLTFGRAEEAVERLALRVAA